MTDTTRKNPETQNTGKRPSRLRPKSEVATVTGRVRMGGLNEMERKALLAMSDPKNFGKSHAEMAGAAGLEGRQLARVKRNPAFQTALLNLTLRRMGEQMPAIMAACVASAQKVGKDGFPDRQMLFKLLGLDRESVLAAMGLSNGTADQGGSVADRLAKATTMRPIIEAAAEDVKFEDAEGAPVDDDPDSEPEWGGEMGGDDEEPQETADW